jgi:hypothetical protein
MSKARQSKPTLVPRLRFPFVDLLRTLGAIRPVFHKWQLPANEVNQVEDYTSRRLHELSGVRRVTILEIMRRLAKGQNLDPGPLGQIYQPNLADDLRALLQLDRIDKAALWRELYRKFPIVRAVHEEIFSASPNFPALEANVFVRRWFKKHGANHSIRAVQAGVKREYGAKLSIGAIHKTPAWQGRHEKGEKQRKKKRRLAPRIVPQDSSEKVLKYRPDETQEDPSIAAATNELRALANKTGDSLSDEDVWEKVLEVAEVESPEKRAQVAATPKRKRRPMINAYREYLDSISKQHQRSRDS